MAEERKQRKCRACNCKVLAMRKGTNHVLHLLLSLCTIGFWIPVWIFSTVKIGGWRCPTCGGKC